MTAPRRVIGVDPGSAKAGYAVVEASGSVLEAGIESVAALAGRLGELARKYAVDALAIGSGTASAATRGRLAPLGLPIHLVDERETTRYARELYFAEHPPRGWRRLLPRGLQTPPCPIDDYAAVLIARRFFTSEGAETSGR
ncbi:MAG TPA: pre-16S rRNA-processing nuclease YqgF [Verrucomicrobiae bacterium]|nr:pre-16S rRNA-processing nuclease YqgF [Verrucomicrobiae bacterium]